MKRNWINTTDINGEADDRDEEKDIFPPSMVIGKADKDDEEEEDDLDLDTLRKTVRKPLKDEDEYSSAGEPGEEDLLLKDFSGNEEIANGVDDAIDANDIETHSDGEAYEPFNLKAELEEGRFDRETGAYVPERDASNNDDTWLADITKEDMERARVAEERRAEAFRQETETKARASLPPSDWIRELANLVELGESPLEAIQRRGSSVTRRFDAKSKRMAASKSPQEKAEEERKRRELERITELCSSLMDHGLSNIYESTREELLRHPLNKPN